MGYQLENGCVTRAPQRAADQGCAEPIKQAYGNSAANRDLERAQQTPVDVAVMADDGTSAMALATGSQALFGSETASFPNLDGIADAALEQAAGRPIHRLRIVVHGTPGRMWFGDQSMDYLHLMGDTSSFSKLKGHFAPDGFIELHSCQLAEFAESDADNPGLDFSAVITMLRTT